MYINFVNTRNEFVFIIHIMILESINRIHKTKKCFIRLTYFSLVEKNLVTLAAAVTEQSVRFGRMAGEAVWQAGWEAGQFFLSDSTCY